MQLYIRNKIGGDIMAERVNYQNASKLVSIDFKNYQKQFQEDGLSEDAIFEYYITENYLNDKNLDLTETKSGLVNNSNDWGIDGFYIFFNNQFINTPDYVSDRIDDGLTAEDLNINGNSKSSTISLYLFQYKNKSKFEEGVIDKINIFIDKLFDYDLNYKSVVETGAMDEELLYKLFVYHSLINIFPRSNVNVKIIHATRGNTSDASSSYLSKKEYIENKLKEYSQYDKSEFVMLDSNAIQNLTKYSAPIDGQLTATAPAISTEFGDNLGYLATVRVRDYYKFITVEDSNNEKMINERLFEANIRDYMNRSGINKQIEETVRAGVKDNDGTDFWWLNNGITILADEGIVRGNTFSLDNIQIVNGLQTSYSIFHALVEMENKGIPIDKDDRSVFLKIIITNDTNIRDEIIKSTNSQNAVNASSLRATDPIQRNIEKYLSDRGLYYDRRKNYYRNKGYQTNSIFDTNYLVQALVSILQQKPSKARSNPTILTKKDEDYDKLFSDTIPLDTYYGAVHIRKDIEKKLKDVAVEKISPVSRVRFGEIRNYYVLHLTWIVTSLLSKNVHPNKNNLESIVKDRTIEFDDIVLEEAIKLMSDAMDRYNANSGTKGKKNAADISKLDAINDDIKEEIKVRLR